MFVSLISIGIVLRLSLGLQREFALIRTGLEKLRTDPNYRRGGVSRGAGVIESFGAPISFLVVPLTQMLGRPVLDETGIDGRFKYKLEYRTEPPREKLGSP